jgi:putative serine protease PepD
VLPPAEQRDPADIAHDVLPSVVRLEVSGPRGTTIGSGVVFRDDGHVLTSAQLLDQASGVVAVVHSGQTVEARIVGADATSDVGVVKVDGLAVPSAPLGSVSGLQKGEAIIAIGPSPTADRAPVISRSVVSDVGARLVDEQERPLYGMLRFNAVAGTSGAGAIVVDQFGAVIGVTTPRQPVAGLTTTSLTLGGDSFGTAGTPATFATPVDYARKVADDIISTGQAQHVWLGVEQADSEVRGTGARLYHVAADSPADVAGLEADDVLMTVGGHRVHSMADVIVGLREHRPGETVEIEYRRGDRVLTCSSTLGSPPSG